MESINVKRHDLIPIWGQLSGEVFDLVTDKLRRPVWRNVEDQMKNLSKDKVESDFKNKVG